MVEKKQAEFQRYFDTKDRFIDRIMSELSGQYRLDVIGFTQWLISQGYDEKKHGTTQDFISARYGEEACAFIRGLI